MVRLPQLATAASSGNPNVGGNFTSTKLSPSTHRQINMDNLKEKIKKKVSNKVFATVIVSALTYLTITILPHLGAESFLHTGPEKFFAIILVDILYHVITLSTEIELVNNTTEESIKENIKKIVEILKVHNDYFDDRWLFNVFDSIADIMHDTNKYKNDLGRVKSQLDEAIAKAKALIGTPYYVDKLDEWDRVNMLRQAQEMATSVVYAVTIDVRNYYENFWQGLNEEDYLKMNIQAAKKNGVIIQRIFIMEKDVLIKNGTDKSKHFNRLITELKKGGENINLFFLDIEVFRKIKNIPDTSFFLCDEVIASESGISDDNSGGNYSINEIDRYKKLKTRFEILLQSAKRI